MGMVGVIYEGKMEIVEVDGDAAEINYYKGRQRE